VFGMPPPIIDEAIFYMLAIYSGDMFCIMALACRIMLGSIFLSMGLKLAAYSAAALSYASLMDPIWLACCLSCSCDTCEGSILSIN
jgi:hypothetical protein